jgi:Fe-S-cluster containining protein
MDTELDCRTCGACCRGRPGTVLVDSSDLARFRAAGRGDLESTLVEGHFSLAALPTRGEGQCLYQGTDQSHTDCAIYEIRPGACRAFSKGSGECLNARQRGRRDR